MAKRVFVRVGAYEGTPSDGLSSFGCRQIQLIGQRIRQLACVDPVIICSPTKRAFQCAELLRTMFGTEAVVCIGKPEFDLLEKDTQALLEAIKANESHEFIIVLGHHVCFEDKGAAYAYAMFVVRITNRFPLEEIHYGDSVIIDTAQKTAQYLCCGELE